MRTSIGHKHAYTHAVLNQCVCSFLWRVTILDLYIPGSSNHDRWIINLLYGTQFQLKCIIKTNFALLHIELYSYCNNWTCMSICLKQKGSEPFVWELERGAITLKPQQQKRQLTPQQRWYLKLLLLLCWTSHFARGFIRCCCSALLQHYSHTTLQTVPGIWRKRRRILFVKFRLGGETCFSLLIFSRFPGASRVFVNSVLILPRYWEKPFYCVLHCHGFWSN